MRAPRHALGLGCLLVAGSFAAFAACSSTVAGGAPDGGEPAPSTTTPSPTTTTTGSAPPPDDASASDGAPNDASTVDAAPPDPCSTRASVCTAVPGGADGRGLTTIDRCAFPIAQRAGFGGNGAILTALEALATKVTVSDVVADTNRDAVRITSVPGNPPGLAYAFRWNTEDVGSADWFPQGITGSADADATGLVGGKRILVVASYEDAVGLEKGVRLAFTDVTNLDTPRYRFALLVEPTGSAAAPSYRQVNIHAGGIVWIGSRLYVADTGTGFRVFDMSRILRVAVDVDSVGCDATTCRAGLYKYVVPQIGTYADSSACAPLFSWVSLDRSTTPISLVSGEYCSTTACSGPLAGRVYRWPLDPTTDLLAGRTTYPSEAFYMGERQVQGGASRNGTFLFSSSAPAGGAGAMFRVKGSRSATSSTIDTPEDLMIEPTRGLVWGLSEGVGSRVVFAANLASYPAP